jgi:hypothetical protein
MIRNSLKAQKELNVTVQPRRVTRPLPPPIKTPTTTNPSIYTMQPNLYHSKRSLSQKEKRGSFKAE